MRHLGLAIVLSLMTLTASAQVEPFVVTTVDDSGPGTLRQAILDANGTVGRDTIEFAIPGPGPHVIRPATPLPDIVDGIFIDGYSQPDSAPNTLQAASNADIRIVLDGSLLPDEPASENIGLSLRTTDCTVGGLSIVGFAFTGIRIARPNPLDPPVVTGCDLFGNFIGVLPDGETAAGNGDGVAVAFGARGNTIGGPTPIQRNVISGNLVRGVIMSSRGNRVQGNLIGLDAAGEAAVGGGAGIFMLLGGNADGDDTLIGGDVVGAGNRFAGLGSASILISGNPDAPAENLRIIDNVIGLDAAGVDPVPNPLGSGVVLSDTADAEIRGNVIGASLTGIALDRGAVGTLVVENVIGPFPAAGNGTGVSITNAARDSRIGDAATGLGNTIAFSERDGVDIQGADTLGHRLSSNRIHDNGELGVDLGNIDSGPTPNDADDADVGGNTLLNFPEIASARSENGQWLVELAYRGAPNTSLVFELFANAACDPSGFGEGERPIGSLPAVTDGTGLASASGGFPTPPAGFDVLTANAGDAAGNTSEFSACARPTGREAPVAVPVRSPGAILLLFALLAGAGLWTVRGRETN